jgi:hypothetical protein
MFVPEFKHSLLIKGIKWQQTLGETTMSMPFLPVIAINKGFAHFLEFD